VKKKIGLRRINSCLAENKTAGNRGGESACILLVLRAELKRGPLGMPRGESGGFKLITPLLSTWCHLRIALSPRLLKPYLARVSSISPDMFVYTRGECSDVTWGAAAAEENIGFKLHLDKLLHGF